MIKPHSKILPIVLLVCFSFKGSYGQTKYGDGTLLLRSDFSSTWNNSNSVYDPVDSNDYKYKANNYQSEKYTRKYNTGLSMWEDYYVNVTDYDNAGNLLIYADSFLKTTDFDSRYKEIYQYNSNNMEIEGLQYYWDTNLSDWVPDERATTTYGPTGYEIVDLREKYNVKTGKYTNSIIRNYTYGPNDKLLFYIKDVWDTLSNSWLNDYKVQYYQDSANYTDSSIIKKYDKNLKTYVNESKSSYTYNNEHKWLTHSRFVWVNNAWVPDARTTNTYHSSGQLEVVVNEFWNKNLKALVNSSRITYQYNAPNWLTLELNDKWDATKSDWIA